MEKIQLTLVASQVTLVTIQASDRVRPGIQTLMTKILLAPVRVLRVNLHLKVNLHSKV